MENSIEETNYTSKVDALEVPSDFSIVTFYRELIENFPLETVLKTLARILLVAKEKKLTEHYEIAKTLFDKTRTMMNLQYRDIAVMTTGAKELELYPDLKDHQLNTDLSQGLPELEKLINHPVHISPTTGLSSFIPFCSFGGVSDLSGRQNTGNLPVCGLFKEKIVEGQLCYEADLNQLKGLVKWRPTLQKGLSLVIDTNDEYDVKNILEKQSLAKIDHMEIFPIYKLRKNIHNFRIMLQTISR